MESGVFEDLDGLVEAGYITRRKHPLHDLYILNYTPKTQYEGLWNDTTKSCRGLIVDGDGRVRARCFRKFFNYEEVKDEVADRIGMGFRTFEKLDGSLGILYWAEGRPAIATRGSFASDQAIRGTSILRSMYGDADLDTDLTYLFEIVYPENRICVDYGDREDLVLLAAFHTESGDEVDPPSTPFPTARAFDLGSDFDGIKALNLENREGFVVRFDDGYRFKVKFADYVALHAAIFSVSTRSVWNCLRSGEQIPLDRLPDEVYDWVRRVESELNGEYVSIESRASEIFGSIRHLSRKEFAAAALEYGCSAILFRMLDGRPYGDMIWKMVEPEYRTPRHEEA
jgi:RNA ligase